MGVGLSKNDTRNQIYQIMDHDEFLRSNTGKRSRHVYGISDLSESKYTYDLSKIAKNTLFSKIKPTRSVNMVFFTEFFYGRYPFMKDIDYDNVLVAGGSVATSFLNQMIPVDIDIFFYDLTEEQANLKVKEIGDHVIDYCEDNAYTFKVFKGKHLTKMFIETDEGDKLFEIQLIFRLYLTKADILYSFDLGSSAIGFDGKSICFSWLGVYSYANMINIIDQKRESDTYSYRLAKYYHRGFSIILPFIKSVDDGVTIGDLPDALRDEFSLLKLKGKTKDSSSDYGDFDGTGSYVYYKGHVHHRMFINSIGSETVTIYLSEDHIEEMINVLKSDMSKSVNVVNLDQLNKIFTSDQLAEFVKMNEKERLDCLMDRRKEIAESISDMNIENRKRIYTDIQWKNISSADFKKLSSTMNPKVVDPMTWYGYDKFSKRKYNRYNDFIEKNNGGNVKAKTKVQGHLLLLDSKNSYGKLKN